MKAAVLQEFRQPLVVRDMPEPELSPNGAIVRVRANGICRSDWHAWMGDWDWIGLRLPLPHVLGHEFSGVIEEVGSNVTQFRKGQRVVVPFTQGDGTCLQCRSGHQNICDHVQMPGFSYWGGYGEMVHVPNADVNLVMLPDGVSFTDAAALGCRVMTAFHGLVDQVQVRPGEWVAVHGCGGVGLSAIQIAVAVGANVIAVDIADDKLAFAKKLGATVTVNARTERVRRVIKEVTDGGAHVSVDALGIAATCQAAIGSLRKRGRHLQIGMTTGAERGMVPLPVDLIVQHELQVYGALGMPPSRYPELLQMVVQNHLRPGELVTRTISVHDAGETVQSMSSYSGLGVTVITDWQ
jgi:D-arabinose 1-dehydrogenase-like Zn-dependent alcohol dehydrogenase